jgi:predicted dehydrogenase
MGSRHAAALARLRDRGAGVTLAGLVDRSPVRAQAVAATTRAARFDDTDRLSAAADAVIVAVRTQGHFEVARRALDAGLHVLVEKPCCATVVEAERLSRQARRLGRVLQVGHLEWFNPAWQAVRTSAERPVRIAAKRIGPFSPGGADTDVVFDLMIHDIHLIQGLLDEEPVAVEATGRALFGPKADVVRARLRFAGGCIATLLASRAATARTRVCRVRGRSTAWAADFVGQSATVAEKGTLRTLAGGRCDLLEEQILAFRSAVRGDPTDAVQAPAVLGSLRTAQRISARLVRSPVLVHRGARWQRDME